MDNKQISENDQNVNRDYWTVRCGKFKGLKFRELLDDQPQYCRWVLQNVKDEKTSLYPLKLYLRENMP